MVDNSPYISTVTSDDSSSYEASLLNSRNRINPLYSLCNASDKYRYSLNASYDLDYSRRDSVFSNQDSAFSNQDSAFSNQDAAFSNQDSAFSNQDTVFSHRDSAFSNQDSAFSNHAYGYPSSLFRSRRFSLDDSCSAMDSRPLNGSSLLSESSLLRPSCQHRSISFPYASNAAESSFLIPESLPRDEGYCGDSYCFISSRRNSIGAYEFDTLLSEPWVSRDHCDSLKQSFRFQDVHPSPNPSRNRTQAQDSDASSLHASDSSHSAEVSSSEEVKTMNVKVAPPPGVVNKPRERKAPAKKPAPVNTNEPPGNPDDIDPVTEEERGDG